MEKAELIQKCREAMEGFFDHNTFQGDSSGEISANMSCEFDLGEGWSAVVQIEANGYEHTDRWSYDCPPERHGDFWVDAVIASFYGPKEGQQFEERNHKNLSLKITY